MTETLLRDLALNGKELNHRYGDVIRDAILIRLVEEAFLDLFSSGRMNGTVHTCVGQELCATAVAGQLKSYDWVTSNHRCHGHFIAKTKKWESLIDELMGKKSGVCKGIGSSQHLYAEGFLSNGPQASLIPVATGIALNLKLKGLPGIAVSYFGEGTLGEGVLYEALNLASLYSVPQLFVCENNGYSQSTPQYMGVSGSILDRAKAFGIRIFEADTWNYAVLHQTAEAAIKYVRTGNPAFLLIRTYRLNAHSKGDDNRDPDEVNFFKRQDLLSNVMQKPEWVDYVEEWKSKIWSHIESASSEVLAYGEYVGDQLPRQKSSRLIDFKNPKIKMVVALNQAYRETLEKGSFHIGEDICDPYGGAFKVTKGLSTEFPARVKNSSISEAGIIGIGIGMSVTGTPAFVEIMFGDFMTHAFDQIISNASKFHHMYAFQASVPLRIRTPMGGKRGYGPTHSQSLEKHFVGVDNLAVIALTSLFDPILIMRDVNELLCPVVLIENKVDYGKSLWNSEDGLFSLRREAVMFGSIVISPTFRLPTITVVSYGETARHLADNLKEFFTETDFVPELICLLKLNPIDISLIMRSAIKTRSLLVVEDGSINFGIGAEILSQLMENGVELDFCLRVGSEAVPIPSIASLETEILPSIARINRLVNQKLKEQHYD